MVRRRRPTDAEWEELGHAWWSKWEWCPMPTSAIYAHFAHTFPGFEYTDLKRGSSVRFGQDLHDRWLERPILGPFRLHRTRPRWRPVWALYPRDRAFPVHIDQTVRFVESLTPESYEAVMAAALELRQSGNLSTVSNTALDPSEPEHIGFELNGVLLDQHVPQPRLIHDATWKRPRVLQAEIYRDVMLDARLRWKLEDNRHTCSCGCQGEVKAVEFLPGHNTKHRAELTWRAQVGDPLAEKELLGRGWVTVEQLQEWEAERLVLAQKAKLRKQKRTS